MSVDFAAFLETGWNDHAADARAVLERMPAGLALLSKEAQIAPLTGLLTHVAGEHLGEWEHGLRFLDSLAALSLLTAGGEASQVIRRSRAVLELGARPEASVEHFAVSDRIRVLATAAAALSGRGRTAEAEKRFLESLRLASSGLPAGDPAIRALAVTGNNLAAVLEEKIMRTPAEVSLMILAAETARKFWEQAGTWLEVERAEYRLAMTFLAAEKLAEARSHAQTCLVIVEANAGLPIELFSAHEARARTARAEGDDVGFKQAREQAREAFARMNETGQWWSREALQKLEKL